MDNLELLDKGMIHISDRTQQDGISFHYTTQNGTQFQTYELFLEFSISYYWTEIMEWETAEKRGCYCSVLTKNRMSYLYSLNITLC